jgi:hypothetical protein
MVVILISILLILSSCASIINGPDQRVRVLSDPPGAEIKINGQVAGITPATFKLIRSKDHIISVSKEGYLEQSKDVKRSLSGVAILYLLPGGLVSFGIDATQGSQFCFPDQVHIKMPPLSTESLDVD